VRFFVALLVLAACRGKTGAPPCESVGAKFVSLAKFDLEKAKLDDETRRNIGDQLPAMRDSLVNACKDSEWDPAVRTCLVDALDHVAFERCQRDLTPAQRDRLERGEPDER
jgi:hypothetical protein